MDATFGTIDWARALIEHEAEITGDGPDCAAGMIHRAAVALYRAHGCGSCMAHMLTDEAADLLLGAALRLPAELSRTARDLADRCVWNFGWPLYGEVTALRDAAREAQP